MANLPNTDLDLTVSERNVVDAAQEALIELSKTFDHWEKVGRGLAAIRAKADRIGGRKTFDRLREQAGLGETLIARSAVSKLLRVMDELPAVIKWRDTLTERERLTWQSPDAILRHCPVFKPATADAAPNLSPMAKVQRALAEALEENHRLKQSAADGGLFDLKRDTIDSIAKGIVDTITPGKARAITERVRKLLKLKSTQAG